MSRNLYLGIDLGGTNCRLGLTAGQGELLSVQSLPTDLSAGAEVFIARLGDVLRQMAAFAKSQGYSLRAGGIGIPGIVHPEGRIAHCPNLPQLDGVALAARLETFCGCPLHSLNDANAIALGEGRFGAARDLPSFLAVTLGTGVGGGLVLNGELWSGPDGAAGEVGHLMVEAEGRPCGCGSRGCLEAYASATGIVASVREALDSGAASALTARALSAAAVARAAGQGDGVAREAFRIAGERLGQALSGVVNLLNLDGLLFAGGVSASFALLAPALERVLQARLFALPRARLQLRTAALGDAAGILGAAGVAAAATDRAQ